MEEHREYKVQSVIFKFFCRGFFRKRNAIKIAKTQYNFREYMTRNGFGFSEFQNIICFSTASIPFTDEFQENYALELFSLARRPSVALCVHNASEGNAARGKSNKQQFLKFIRERYNTEEFFYGLFIKSQSLKRIICSLH